MAQNLPTIAQLFGIEESSLVRFREMLSPHDQQALDELFETTQIENLTNVFANRNLPKELFLFAMLLEHHKILNFLIGQLDYYGQKMYYKQSKLFCSSSGESFLL